MINLLLRAMARKEKAKVKLKCLKCGKEPQENKQESTEHWAVVDNKPCEYCGGEIKFSLTTE